MLLIFVCLILGHFLLLMLQLLLLFITRQSEEDGEDGF